MSRIEERRRSLDASPGRLRRTIELHRRTHVVSFKTARNNRAYQFSSGELAEQTPRGKKVHSLKAFGEPLVNPFQQLDGLLLAALIGP